MRETRGTRARQDPGGSDVRLDLRGAQRGATLIELMGVLFVLVLIVVISSTILADYYRDQQLVSAVMTVQNGVWGARYLALKEKTAHRILLRDESDSPSSVVEVQRDDGGSFVTLPGKTYFLPSTVRILGTAPSDSVDWVDIGRRGECDTGLVYLQGHDGEIRTVSVSTGCLAEEL